MSDPTDQETCSQRLLRLARARNLPGLEFSAPGQPSTLKVAGSHVAEVHDANTVLLHCPSDQKVLLMDISPDIYFETEAQIGKDIMLIRLDQIDDEELSLRLHDAWSFRAPEHLRKLSH